MKEFTGRSRLQPFLGVMALQFEIKGSHWVWATPKDVSENFQILNKLDSSKPFTDEELAAVRERAKVLQELQKQQEEFGLRNGTEQVIGMIRKALKNPKPDPYWKTIFSRDLGDLPRFYLREVKEAFPNLRISINGNEGSSGDPSLEVCLPN